MGDSEVKVFDNVMGIERTVIARADAAALVEMRFFTGVACKRGHVTERWVSNGNCIGCAPRSPRKAVSLARAFDNVKGVERDVVTREEARELGLRRYFTGEACKRGHVAERDVPTCKCVECARLVQRIEHMTPQQVDKQNAYSREYNSRTGCYRTENMTAEQVERRRVRARVESKTREQLERQRATARKASAEERIRLKLLKPYLKPAWANDDAIRAVYALATKLTAESGVVHHVDHIVAIQGRTAVGFHTEANLRVVPGRENESKHAKLDEALAVDPAPPQCTLASCRCGTRAALFTPLLAA